MYAGRRMNFPANTPRLGRSRMHVRHDSTFRVRNVDAPAVTILRSIVLLQEGGFGPPSIPFDRTSLGASWSGSRA
jgi:hypothetical protein